MTSFPHSDTAASIAVVDYCKGNLRSVEKGLQSVGYDAFITSDPDRIAQADGIVLPGVGAFCDAATYMQVSGQAEAVVHRVGEGAAFLGICLGMQLLFDKGSEGARDGWIEGLGLLPGRCERLSGENVKVPHVGWNIATFTGQPDPLFEGIPSGAHFYFTHSYNCVPQDESCVTSTTEHSMSFPASVRLGRVHGVQFHPEKSSTVGLALLRNFGRLVDQAKDERNSR